MRINKNLTYIDHLYYHSNHTGYSSYEKNHFSFKYYSVFWLKRSISTYNNDIYRIDHYKYFICG